MGADGQLVTDPAAIEAAECQIVAVNRAAPAERREHASVKAELAEPLGELRLIKEDIEIERFSAPGIVGDCQPDIVRALREGEVLEIEGAGVDRKSKRLNSSH